MTRAARITHAAVVMTLAMALATIGPAPSAVAIAPQAPGSSSDDAPRSRAGAHVDVTALPQMVLAGQHVTISGATAYSAKQPNVTVRVRHESGTPSATLSAAVTPNGQFNVTFADTTKGGRYEVLVTSPDGKGSGSTSFRVGSIAGLAGEVEQLSSELDKRTKALVTFVKTTAAALPPSPERDDLVQKAQQVEQQATAANLPPVKVLSELKKLVPQKSDVSSPDAAVFKELGDWVPEAEEAIDRIDRSRILEKPAPLCETINTAIEGAKFAAYAFSISSKLLTTLVKITVDKGIPAIVEHLGFQGPDATAMSYGLKVSGEGVHGAVAAVTAGMTLLTDWVEIAAKVMFNRYCGSFDGPLDVTMTMVWNEGSQPWLKYGVRLAGRLRLRFPKESPAGKPVYLTGELEGNATNFTFWEDVTIAEGLPRSILILERRWLAPIPFKNSTASPLDFGMVARAVTPAYFNVPVIGEMTGDTVKMQFKEARADFSAAVSNRLLFVVMTPLMPDYKLFTFPIQKAHWILSKGFSDPCILTVDGAQGQKAIRLKQSAAHRETSNKSVVVDWVIDLDAKKTGDAQRQ